MTSTTSGKYLIPLNLDPIRDQARYADTMAARIAGLAAEALTVHHRVADNATSLAFLAAFELMMTGESDYTRRGETDDEALQRRFEAARIAVDAYADPDTAAPTYTVTSGMTIGETELDADDVDNDEAAIAAAAAWARANGQSAAWLVRHEPYGQARWNVAPDGSILPD